ncbi:MAG TPA: short chain dehydrogenase [Thermoanaerobaculia bacterium]|nr:short chain dehydrogenase [Thermoanaerobaculia bacterium]
MRILVIGSHGTIGREIVKALADGNEIIGAARKDADLSVDITDPNSIVTMYAQLGRVDAVVCAAGGGAWKPLDQLSGEDFDESLGNKLMGQVNVIRYGLTNVNDGGSITVTSGVLSRSPMVGSAAISLVNAGLEGFVRAAALEAPRGVRVNVVSPPWVTETLAAMGATDTSHGLPAATVAEAYVRSVTGNETGQVLEPYARGAQRAAGYM